MLNWLAERTPWELLAAGSLLAMTVGSIVRLTTLGSSSAEQRRNRLGSLRTWWILLLILLVSSAFGRWGVIAMLSVASALALEEFLKMTRTDLSPKLRRAWIAIIVGATYLLIGFFPTLDYRGIVPILVGWSLVVPHLLSDSPRQYLEHVGNALWGGLVLVWGVAHAAWLVAREVPLGDEATRVGWLLMLIILTEFNDIAQALIGRSIGKHRILPRVSPNKTWEGFVGGLISTVVVALLLQIALQLRPLANIEVDRPYSLLAMSGAALVVAISGFVGDLNMSCVKRDVGVKDGSKLLPGQGGMVDRIDSLSFTAPALMLWTALV